MRNRLSGYFEFKIKKKFELKPNAYNSATCLFYNLPNDSLDFDQVTEVGLFKGIYEFWLPPHSVLKWKHRKPAFIVTVPGYYYVLNIHD